MRLTLTLLGWELDIMLGPEAAEVEGASLDGGTLSSTPQPIGFTPWDADGPVHQFEPEDGR